MNQFLYISRSKSEKKQANKTTESESKHLRIKGIDLNLVSFTKNKKVEYFENRTETQYTYSFNISGEVVSSLLFMGILITLNNVRLPAPDNTSKSNTNFNSVEFTVR